MPDFLSSLLHRTRTGILVMLLVVLPLQSVGQLVAGPQAHRHLHTGVASPATAGSVLAGLRAVLDRLHAAQEPRLAGHAWLPSSGPADGWHAHGGVHHRHGHDTHDVLNVADHADDAQPGGATAFQAWLPAGLAFLPAEGGDRPAGAAVDWRDRVIAPPLMPPRG